MKIEVEKVLTKDEFSELFDTEDENDYYLPTFVDANEDDWIEWFYKHGYRLVKIKTLNDKDQEVEKWK